MKDIIKKISIISVLILSLFTAVSCEDDNTETQSSDVLQARFTRTQEGKTVTFINISENATAYVWDFGDGTTSTLVSPEKRYDNGSYTVKLTATNNYGDSSTVEDSFTIDGCNDELAENTSPENGPLNMTLLSSGFDAFGNIGGGIVNNPLLDGVNSSCNVFLYNKLGGCETWSGAGYVLDAPLDFSVMTEKVFKLKVLAQTQITDVTLLLEFKPFPNNNPFQQRVASITQVGEWQELTFDFSDLDSGTFENIVIYFDRNAACDGDIYYFDDLIQQ